MLKKIKFALLALLLPAIALAQTYPSPTYKNVTIQGTLAVTGAPTFTVPIPVASGGTGVTTSTGTGSVVLSTSPTFATPALGAASASSLSVSNSSGTNVSILNTINAATSNGQVPGLKVGVGSGTEAGWISNPAANDWLPLYAYISSSAVRNRIWGINTDVDVTAGNSATAWGAEFDMNVATANAPDPHGTNMALGIDVVSGGTFAPSAAYSTLSTTLANRWKHGLWFENVGGQTGSTLIKAGVNVSVDYGLDISGATVNVQGVRVGNTPAAQVAGIGLRQFANGNTGLFLQRFTDTAPTGNLIQLTNAANSVVLGSWDVGGNITATGISATSLAATGTGAMPMYGTTGTAVNAPHMVQGSVALAAGTATVTLSGSAVYTSSSSYTCTANDATAANAVKVSQGSGTSITFTGTGTDTVQFMCAGN